MSKSDSVTPAFQPGVELRSLHSEITSQDLRLFIKLPWGYDRTDTMYPVLFALDANRSFFLYSTMSLIYETPPSASQETVIVGIGYALTDDRIKGLAQWAAWRTRDLTPERREDTERSLQGRLSAMMGDEEVAVRSGGAAAFLESMRLELIPFVESNYRVSPSGRGLAGYSFGGSFVFYTLFHAPAVFNRFFAGSPSMWDVLFEYEDQYASTHSDLDATLLMTVGGLETDSHEAYWHMVQRLQSRRYPGLKMQAHVFEGEGHESAYAASVSRALRVLYGVV